MKKPIGDMSGERGGQGNGLFLLISRHGTLMSSYGHSGEPQRGGSAVSLRNNMWL